MSLFRPASLATLQATVEAQETALARKDNKIKKMEGEEYKLLHHLGQGVTRLTVALAATAVDVHFEDPTILKVPITPLVGALGSLAGILIGDTWGDYLLAGGEQPIILASCNALRAAMTAPAASDTP